MDLVDPFKDESRRWGRAGAPLLLADEASGSKSNPVRLGDVPQWGNPDRSRFPSVTRFNLPSTSALNRDRSATPPPLSRQPSQKVMGFLKVVKMKALLPPQATPFRFIELGRKLMKSSRNGIATWHTPTQYVSVNKSSEGLKRSSERSNGVAQNEREERETRGRKRSPSPRNLRDDRRDKRRRSRSRGGEARSTSRSKSRSKSPSRSRSSRPLSPRRDRARDERRKKRRSSSSSRGSPSGDGGRGGTTEVSGVNAGGQRRMESSSEIPRKQKDDEARLGDISLTPPGTPPSPQPASTVSLSAGANPPAPLPPASTARFMNPVRPEAGKESDPRSPGPPASEEASAAPPADQASTQAPRDEQSAVEEEAIPKLPIGATAAFTTAVCKLVNYESSVTTCAEDLEKMFESAILEPDTVPKILLSNATLSVLRKVLKRLETFIDSRWFDTEKKMKGAVETRDELRLCLKIIDDFREEMAKPPRRRKTKRKRRKKPAGGARKEAPASAPVGIPAQTSPNPSSASLPFVDDEVQEIPVPSAQPPRPAIASSSLSSSSSSESDGEGKKKAGKMSLDADCMEIVKLSFNYDEEKFKKFLETLKHPEDTLQKIRDLRQKMKAAAAKKAARKAALSQPGATEQAKKACASGASGGSQEQRKEIGIDAREEAASNTTTASVAAPPTPTASTTGAANSVTSVPTSTQPQLLPAAGATNPQMHYYQPQAPFYRSYYYPQYGYHGALPAYGYQAGYQHGHNPYAGWVNQRFFHPHGYPYPQSMQYVARTQMMNGPPARPHLSTPSSAPHGSCSKGRCSVCGEEDHMWKGANVNVVAQESATCHRCGNPGVPKRDPCTGPCPHRGHNQSVVSSTPVLHATGAQPLDSVLVAGSKLKDANGCNVSCWAVRCRMCKAMNHVENDCVPNMGHCKSCQKFALVNYEPCKLPVCLAKRKVDEKR